MESRPAHGPFRAYLGRTPYGVEVASGQDPALMLAITAVLDQVAHEAR